MPLGGAIVAGGGLIGSLIGSSSASDARKEAARQSALQQEQIQKAIADLEAVGVPSIEAQQIAIDKYMPELQGTLQAETLGNTAMDEISLNPEVRNAQMAALRQMQELGQTGLNAEDRMARQEMLDQSSSQDQARQSSILQSMAERGSLDSGAQLAAQLQSKQNQAEAARKSGLQLAAQVSQARRDALAQAGQLGTQMRSQSFGEQSSTARAKDAISQFNAQNRQKVAERNLNEQQRIAEQRAAIQRQQEVQNKGVIGTQYNQRLGKAKAMSSARTGAANNYGNNASAQTSAAGAYSKASGKMLGEGLAAGAKLYGQYKADKGKADGGVKEEDTNILKKILQSILSPSPKKIKIPRSTGGIRAHDGGISKMGYEESGDQTEGRIVPGDMYSGDELEDKINSGEMVINVEQQELLNNLLKELKQRRLEEQSEPEERTDDQSEQEERIDEQLDRGQFNSNEDQQNELMSVLRNEKDVTEMNDDNIIEHPQETDMRQLLKMLKMG